MFFGALISKIIHIQRLKMAKYNNYSFHLGQNYIISCTCFFFFFSLKAVNMYKATQDFGSVPFFL